MRPFKTKIKVQKIKIKKAIKLGIWSWNPKYKFWKNIKIKEIKVQKVRIPRVVKVAKNLTSRGDFTLEKLAILTPTRGKTHGIKFKIKPEARLSNAICINKR